LDPICARSILGTTIRRENREGHFMREIGRGASRGTTKRRGGARAPLIRRTFTAVLGTAVIAFGGAALSAGAAAPGASNAPTCFGKTATIIGTPQSEVIRGTSDPDVIVSLAGNDGVLSRQGDDYVCSGAGNDTIHGAEGFNRMDGGGGHDWIDGRRGPGNIVRGGDGPDHLAAEGRLDGGAGNDIIESYGYLNPSLSPVADVSVGGKGDDDIYGCGGTVAPQRPTIAPGPARERSWAWPDCYSASLGNAEQLSGGADDDTVFGGGGNDGLNGNGGNDALYGEDGNDDMNGGRGRDTCRQNAGTGTRTACP
jgi:Ca2+-binding RTX toxin-like protein